MLFLISLLGACAFVWLCAKPLKRHPVLFYCGSAMLTIAVFVLGRMHLQGVPPFVSTYVIGSFTRGTFAAALWCVVAWMGALPNGSAAIKKLMPVRGELSIFAAIVTLSHAVTYSITYIQRLLLENADSSMDFILTCIVSLLLMLIMIPLTVMSFKAVRRKMKPKTWKAIQRTAYLFYALIYVHVLVILLPRAWMGREGTFLSILVYSSVFLGYAVMRIRKYILMRKKPESRIALNAVCTACFALGMFGLGVIARPVKVPVTSAEQPMETTQLVTKTTFAATETEPVSAKISTETYSSTESVSEAVMETETVTTEAAATESETVETIGETPAPDVPTEIPSAEEPILIEQIPAEPEPTPEPEPVYIYNNGIYHVDIFGYDADEHFDITIENDVITAIEGYCDESDPWYFDTALPAVRGAILAANSPDVPDAVSGATISSECIKNAVRQALEQARK